MQTRNCKKPAPLLFSDDNEVEFDQALKQAANAYLTQNNDHRFANTSLHIKNSLAIVLAILCYFLCLSQNSAWLFASYYFGFITLTMFVNINGQHDASHNVLFKSKWANRLFGRIVTVPLGIDPDYWRVRHVDFHHLYPNIEHYDLDMEENGFLRQTPFQRWFPHMKYQHYYWPLVAALSLPYIAWIYDWSDRLGKTAIRQSPPLTGCVGWIIFLASKILHFIIALIIPIMVVEQHGISWQIVLCTYFLTQMLASLIVIMLLLGTHWANPRFYTVPEKGKMKHGWYYHNFMTTCDWQPSQKVWSIFLGGLHLHLTHHLFPGWSHRHYAVLAKIVADLAAQYLLPYRCISYRQLFKEQQQFIKNMAQKPK